MSNCTISFLALGVLFSIIVNIRAPVPEATCKEFVTVLTKRQLGGIASCSKAMKFKNPKEKAAKMNCILKCVMIKEGILAPTGQFSSDEKLDAVLNELVPANLLDLITTKFKHCKTTSGQNLNNEEEFCKSYDPMIKCMLDAMGNLCKT